MIAAWLTAGWLDVGLVAAWFFVVFAIGARIWTRGGDE